MADGLDVRYKKNKRVSGGLQGCRLAWTAKVAWAEREGELFRILGGSALLTLSLGCLQGIQVATSRRERALSACTLDERPDRGHAWAEGHGHMVDTQSRGTR